MDSFSMLAIVYKITRIWFPRRPAIAIRGASPRDARDGPGAGRPP